VIHRNLLLFRGARYLWWSLGLLVISGVLYATQGKVQPPNGGTWQGYVLGSIGALLILWLTYLGVRKRRYNSGIGSRIIFPSTAGVIPIFDSLSALSMSCTVPASKGWTTSKRGSGVVIKASCFNFMADP